MVRRSAALLAVAAILVALATNATAQLDGDAILRGVRAQAPSFHRCYERELRRDPTFRGRFVMTFTVDADGKVRRADVRDAATRSSMTECVRRVLLQLRFPPTGSPVTVSYPFYVDPA